jgi:hypothetical protein
MRHKRAVVHQISLGGQTLDITPQAHQLFESESSYRVYYEPGSKVVVAAEPMEQ